MVEVMSATHAAPVASEPAATKRLAKLRATWQPVLVLATWLVMTIGAWGYISTYASRIPVWDDIDLVPLTDPDVNWTVQELWGLHNEHRLPLPRMIEAELFGVTKDIRTPMYGEVVLLSGLALASILVVRKLRGRTLLADALFPLMWLHTGNSENLLMGFQISIVLPMVVVCSLLLFLLTRPKRGLRSWEAAVAGVCLLSLPMCGGQGMALVPLLWLMCAGFAFVSWRSEDPKLRSGAKSMAVWLALVAALAVCYVVGFRYPDQSVRTHDPLVTLGGALRAGSLTLGLAGFEWWPWSGIVIALLVIASGVLLVLTWKRRAADRLRVGVLIMTFSAGLLLLLSIGFGRAGNGVEAAFAVRYIPMPGPLVLAAVLAWTMYGPRTWSWVVPGALGVVMLCANVYVNTPLGTTYGSARQGLSQEIIADVHNGMSPGTFALKYAGKIHPAATRLHILLREMAKLKLPPFDDVPEVTRQLYSWTMTNLPPSRIESEKQPVQRLLNGQWQVLFVPEGCALHFDVPQDLEKVHGTWGMPHGAVARGRTPGMRLLISASVADGGERVVLYDRTIDPVHVPGDRGGIPMEAHIPKDAHQVVMEFLAPKDVDLANDWAFLGDVTFQ